MTERQQIKLKSSIEEQTELLESRLKDKKNYKKNEKAIRSTIRIIKEEEDE